MDLTRPYTSVVAGLEGDVLVALARSHEPLTGRAVAQLVRRGSPDGVRKALDRLVAQGTVRRTHAGRASLHLLNRQHLAAPAVEILASLRTELLDRMRGELATWTVPALHASLFGSAARGDGDVRSDIDLYVVRPSAVPADDGTWNSQLTSLTESAMNWTGNVVSVVEHDEEAARRLPSARTRLVHDLRRDAIDLAGKPLADFLRQ